jgi:hypothetical protein
MKKTFLFSMLLALGSTTCIAQDCKVLLEPLTGTYEGECKSDKANGKGKAVGKDSYEGEFKAGYPEGKGIYTWSNKDWFDGIWKKGQKEGDGEMHLTFGGTRDSVITGFWKKDKYVGKFEKAYKINSQSQAIQNVNITKMEGSTVKEVAIILSTKSGGTQTLKGTYSENIHDECIDVTKGGYESFVEVPYQPKATKFTVRKVSFPFVAFFRSDSHFVEIAFYEEGKLYSRH